MSKESSESQKKEQEQELNQLSQECDELDQKISILQKNINDLMDKKPFLTFSDVKKYPGFEDKIIIAITAPQGTIMQVPDSSEGLEFPHKRYQVFFESETPSINARLVQEDKENGWIGMKLKQPTDDPDFIYTMEEEGIIDFYDDLIEKNDLFE